MCEILIFYYFKQFFKHFVIFLVDFANEMYCYTFSQQMLTKISENVFHILNSSHLKYHVNTANESWKNLFSTPLAFH